MSASTTNGASLEDAYSNVFVLTELTGLRWKKFVAANDPSRSASDLGADPILWAYGACLGEGLLAVWRRVPRPGAPLGLAAEKELWVFWYTAEEPKELPAITANLTNPAEDSSACGSWNDGVGYDCRTLLFKALHNLIERNLFAAGYLRLGKWFLLPLDHDNSVEHVDVFNFSFFVLGDVYVCASVNTQRQAPLYKLSRAALRREPRSDVTLAPWSWAASLVRPQALGETGDGGQSERRASQAARQWREWTHFFPLPKPDATENVGWVDPDEKEKTEAAKADALPQMLEVSIGGVKMLYPSAYILTTRPPGPKKPVRKGASSPVKRASASHPSPAASGSEPVDLDPHGRSLGNCPLAGTRLVERAVEELALCRRNSGTDLAAVTTATSGSQTPTGSTGPPTPSAAEEPQWDSADPGARESCACLPSSSSAPSLLALASAPSPKSSIPTSPSLAAKAKPAGLVAKDDRKPERKPFHRRSPLTIPEDPKPSPVTTAGPPLPPPAVSTSIAQPQTTVSASPVPSMKPSPAPSITLPANLPPHEPITQMISPAPHANTASAGGAESHTDHLGHFTLPSTSKAAASDPATSLATSATFPARLNKAEVVPPPPSQRKTRKNSAPRLPKRPRLGEMDSYLAAEEAETLPHPPFLYASGSGRDPAWDCPEVPQPAPPDPSLTGLISIPSQDPHPAAPAPFPKIESDVDEFRQMPDNIMETNVPHHDIESQSPWISPPASNERGEECRKGLNGASFLGAVGPPSVGHGPYTHIYPTPPTPQVATSPESLQHRLKEPMLGKLDGPAARNGGDGGLPDVYAAPELAAYRESPKFAPVRLKGAFGLKLPAYQPHAGRGPKEERPGELEDRELVLRMEQRREAAAAMFSQHSFPGSHAAGPLTPRSQPPRPGTSPYGPASLASPYAAINNPRTPLNVQRQFSDIHSPLSNAATPYARHVASVEPAGNPSEPEAHALVATILLSDTPVNLHRDTIFDSCPACACPGGSLNITGSEAGAYVLPHATAPRLQGADQAGVCSCGFSAVRYRTLAYHSGLFAEDEQDATAKWRSHARRWPTTQGSVVHDLAIINLIRHQSLARDLAPQVIYPACAATEASFACRIAGLREVDEKQSGTPSQVCNREEVFEHMASTSAAMDAACLVMDSASNWPADIAWRRRLIDLYGFQRAWNETEPGEAEAQFVVKTVGAVVEKAMGFVRGLAETVDGPMTWRGLVRRAGKDEDASPEPVPQVLLTAEKDLMALSPLSLRLWDKLLLDPYSSPKDVVYVAVVPENPHIFARSTIFFRELSKVYEGYRFGRHCPYTKALPRDGILAVSPKLVQKQRLTVPWLDDPEFQHETPENKARLRAYAQVCQNMLGPLLQQNEGMNAFDRNIFRDVGKESGGGGGASVSSGDAMPPPSGPMESSASEGAPGPADVTDPEAEAGKLPHVVVIYLVNPVLEAESEGRARLSLLALFRSFLNMVSGLPKALLPFVQLEVVDLKTVLDCTAAPEREDAKYVDNFGLDGERKLGPGERVWERRGTSSTLRNLALSVYAQPRNLSPAALSATHAKCLTGLGPTASYLQTVQSRLKADLESIYRIYSPPYILPPSRPVRELTYSKGAPEEGSVLYISYCLSDKQQWLLVTATDQQGSMLDSNLINISTVDLERQHARSGDIIRQALCKLWSFVIAILATGCHPWRLVIGRLGRIGHGELRVWAQLLSKPNLKKTSSIIRDHCAMCSRMPGFHETPAILSAALVSLEAEASLRLLPHIFRHDERFGHCAKQLPLSTPEDASATHILVFPTSAVAQPPNNAPEQDDDDFTFDLGEDDALEGLGLDLGAIGQGPAVDDSGVPGSARPGFLGFFNDTAQLDVNNQPLASGFIISTAPAPGLPSWFWFSNASAARRRSPVHLRAALHIQTARVQDDEFGFNEPVSAVPKSGRKPELDHNHPLDSRRPPDVLRKILQTYNALSWLSVDMGTGDRKSCLPVHMQALLRLYHATSAVLQQ